MIRLSFIVPFYNVEPYIEECIRSLYAQDIPMEEYEVICVDDCSPDGSRAIVERLQKEYPTLQLISHSVNKRQGGARNTGLRAAHGEYIWFIDSDDYICSNVLSQLLATAEKKRLDIMQFDFMRSSDSKIVQYNEPQAVQDGESYIFHDQSLKWSDRICGPWQQLVRRQFLLKEQISFIENAQYEDTDFMLLAFLNAQRVQYFPISAYIYRANRESTTLSSASPQKLAWKINQLVRCGLLIDMCRTAVAKATITDMLYKSFSAVRQELKRFTWHDKQIYRCNITSTLRRCKQYMTWRTWLAIRYGITWFIK